MDFETIILRKEGPVAIVILNRPDLLNAMNAKMSDELELAAKEIVSNDDIRVLVITGSGRAFSAGGDIAVKEILSGELEPGPGVFKSGALQATGMGLLPTPWFKPLSLITEELPKPTIAMVNGIAAGAGMSLALHCDIRIGCPNSKFVLGYPNIGLCPTSEPWFLTRIIGLAKTLELVFTNDTYGGEEAYRIGLLNRLVPNEDLEKETMALANKLAQGSATVHSLSKMLVYKSLVVDLEAEMIMAAAGQYIAACSPDGKEGLKALAEKRRPVFKMKDD